MLLFPTSVASCEAKKILSTVMGNVVHHPKGEERDPALISNKPAREIFEALSEGVAKVDSKRGALRSSGSMDNLKGSKKKIPKRKGGT